MEGRVDTVSGDYTGEPEHTSGQRSDYYQGREGVETYSQRQGVSLDKRITDTKISPKKERRILRTKGSKY